MDLSPKGTEEAHAAGRLLREEGFVFDLAYTSVLRRAIRTLWIVLDEMDLMWIPVRHSWRLNERHYGGLQGLNKGETAEKYGEDQVKIWRRSYAVRPPLLERGEERDPLRDPRYADQAPEVVPLGECLEDTVARVVPYWEQEIVPALAQGRRVLVAAHGNSIRALVKYLDGVSDQDIVDLNIPTGIPLLYDLDDRFHPLGHRYLGDPEAVAAAAAAVANQGKAKG